MKFITDYASAVVFIPVFIVAFYGWGSFISRLLGLRPSKIDCIWVGFSITIFLIEFINFFFKIDWVVSGFIILSGFIFALHSLRNFGACRYVYLLIVIRRPEMLMSLILVSIWVFDSMAYPAGVDYGLYHFNSIRWLNEHSIVAGIGNLHGRLAFNQSWFGMLAHFNLFPFWNHGSAVGGVVVLSIGIVTIFQTIKICSDYGAVFLTLLVIPILSMLNIVSTPSPDIPVYILEIVIACYLLQIARIGDQLSLLTKFATLCILAMTILTIKLSSIFYATACVCISGYILKEHIKFDFTLYRVSLLLLMIFVTHIIRGYILSGVPLYPSTFGAIWSLPWAMPIHGVQEEANWVYCWARSPGDDCMSSLGNWNWFSAWVSRLPAGTLLMFLLSFWGFFASIFYVIWKGRIGIVRPFLFIMLPLLFSIICWFFTAPNIRFLGSILALFEIFSLLIVLKTIDFNTCQSALFRWSTSLRLSNKKLLIVCILTSLSVTLPPKYIFSDGFATISQAKLGTFYTNSGLMLYFPNDPMKPGSDECLDSPLPCTPFPNPRLKIYRAGILTGFMHEF